jgi:pimeloyl-ACP methyl ester carboxylesterase
MTLSPQRIVAEEFDIELATGRIHAQRFGPEGAPLVLGLPGLSANIKSFDFIGEHLSGDVQLVAVDLRGRGRSAGTPPGTYGWVNHARDVFALADSLSAKRFSIVGHSMGAGVAMACAFQDASRIERMVLVDACGTPDISAVGPIGAAVNRLGAVYPSNDAFIGMLRQIGTIAPWSDHWQRYFEYELQPVEGGVASRTDRQAVLEDAAFGAGVFAFGDGAGVYSLWSHLTMPVLLLRAARELLPGFGHIVSERDRDRFAREVPTARVIEVDANHYGIATHEDTASAIDLFLHQP